jgi:hypothetical protein
MQQLAGPALSFTFGGTFGIIIGAGTATGALLGWAGYQRRLGRQYPSRARRIEASAGQDASPGSPSRPEDDGLPGCG